MAAGARARLSTWRGGSLHCCRAAVLASVGVRGGGSLWRLAGAAWSPSSRWVHGLTYRAAVRELGTGRLVGSTADGSLLCGLCGGLLGSGEGGARADVVAHALAPSWAVDLGRL